MATFNHGCCDFSRWVGADTEVYKTSAYYLRMKDGTITDLCSMGEDGLWYPVQQPVDGDEIKYAPSDVSELCMENPLPENYPARDNKAALVNYYWRTKLSPDSGEDKTIEKVIPTQLTLTEVVATVAGEDLGVVTIDGTTPVAMAGEGSDKKYETLRFISEATGKLVLSSKTLSTGMSLVKQTGAELELTVSFGYWLSIQRIMSSPLTDAISSTVPAIVKEVKVIKPGRLNKTPEEWRIYANTQRICLNLLIAPTWPTIKPETEAVTNQQEQGN